jgi:delta 1-pyrroline-5-carboxylate dehydrogenase
VGASHTCQRFNQLLAEREGQLAQLIYEGDLQAYSLLSEPTLCLRFITERTRTINITAVGGNASLLELGSAE